ncbi:MAG: DNA gyrase subunit A, partial [Candidatus Cloacimonetes bacterium]|nr:DNA gyrase subunit A [Candidatus Cloacimonadota bacterium]
MVTRNGIIKKTELSAFSRPRINGIIAIKLIDGDQLIDAQITEGNNDIILATRHGFANRFNENDARAMGRNSQGVKGISLRSGDRVVAMVVVKREGTLLAISENGFGKRTEVSSYKLTKRGSKGVITLKTNSRNGYLISLMEVVDNDDLMIVTKDGMIIRQAVEKIKVIGRNTQGVKLIELNSGDKVYDITRIASENVNGLGANGQEEDQETEEEDKDKEIKPLDFEEEDHTDHVQLDEEKTEEEDNPEIEFDD